MNHCIYCWKLTNDYCDCNCFICISKYRHEIIQTQGESFTNVEIHKVVFLEFLTSYIQKCTGGQGPLWEHYERGRRVYKNSWCRRGWVSIYENIMRKVDRMENIINTNLLPGLPFEDSKETYKDTCEDLALYSLMSAAYFEYCGSSTKKYSNEELGYV